MPQDPPPIAGLVQAFHDLAAQLARRYQDLAARLEAAPAGDAPLTGELAAVTKDAAAAIADAITAQLDYELRLVRAIADAWFPAP